MCMIAPLDNSIPLEQDELQILQFCIIKKFFYSIQKKSPPMLLSRGIGEFTIFKGEESTTKE